VTLVQAMDELDTIVFRYVLQKEIAPAKEDAMYRMARVYAMQALEEMTARVVTWAFMVTVVTVHACARSTGTVKRTVHAHVIRVGRGRRVTSVILGILDRIANRHVMLLSTVACKVVVRQTEAVSVRIHLRAWIVHNVR
jgi:hypothetical protein